MDFFHCCPTRQFNVGEYRRRICGKNLAPEFFDHSNSANVESRNSACAAALKDLKTYMTEGDDCRVAFFDATNSTKERRRWVFTNIEAMGAKAIFLETICTDEEKIMNNIKKVKIGSPDFKDTESGIAIEEFKQRIANYEKIYETIDIDDAHEKDWMWIKMLDSKRFTINNIRGYIPTQMVQFLMHSHPDPPNFYLSRHGQSQYNAGGKIGGDSELTPMGWKFAKRLAVYAHDISVDGDKPIPFRLWTSTLRRTKETAALISSDRLWKEEHGVDWVQFRRREWRNLDEIFAGSCDGMTYAEIAEYYPDEFGQRQEHKLTYRYPRGESYLDLIHRLHNCILEMERLRESVLIIAHQAVLRIIYAYWMGIPKEDAPTVCMPLHTVTKLTPQAYGCKEERVCLLSMEEVGSVHDTSPTANNSIDRKFSIATPDRPDDPPSH